MYHFPLGINILEEQGLEFNQGPIPQIFRLLVKNKKQTKKRIHLGSFYLDWERIDTLTKKKKK